MIIKYFLDVQGNYITPCPHDANRFFLFLRKVGSAQCQSCKYFGSEHLKTVKCQRDINQKGK